MQRRSLIPLAITLILLALSPIAIVFAEYHTSVIYTKFNDTTYTFEALDQTYTSFRAEIKNYLTYNTSESNAVAKVCFFNETTNLKGFLILMKPSSIEVWYKEGLTDVQLASKTSITWTNKTIKVTFDDNKFTVILYDEKEETETTILENFNFNEEITHLGFCGYTNSVTAGYVLVDITEGLGNIDNSINTWLPMILSFACLGIALSFVKKATS